MISGIKAIFRTRLPVFYRGLQSVYYSLRKLGETGPLGGVLNRVGWILKHSIGSSDGFDQTSSAMPHRQHIIDHVASLGPPENILEIGCGYGANLVNLANYFTDTQLAGVDVSRTAIASAQTVPKLAGADLRVHDLGKPLPFADNSFDVVLSDAVLMFFPERRLPALLRELFRVSRHGVILHEYNVEGQGGSVYAEGRWIHDFRHECLGVMPNLAIETVQTPFAGGLWSAHGKFLLIRKPDSEVSCR